MPDLDLLCTALIGLPALGYACHRICDAVRTARWDAGRRIG
jgi:hypothetical protein